MDGPVITVTKYVIQKQIQTGIQKVKETRRKEEPRVQNGDPSERKTDFIRRKS